MNYLSKFQVSNFEKSLPLISWKRHQLIINPFLKAKIQLNRTTRRIKTRPPFWKKVNSRLELVIWLFLGNRHQMKNDTYEIGEAHQYFFSSQNIRFKCETANFRSMCKHWNAIMMRRKKRQMSLNLRNYRYRYSQKEETAKYYFSR